MYIKQPGSYGLSGAGSHFSFGSSQTTGTTAPPVISLPPPPPAPVVTSVTEAVKALPPAGWWRGLKFPHPIIPFPKIPIAPKPPPVPDVKAMQLRPITVKTPDFLPDNQVAKTGSPVMAGMFDGPLMPVLMLGAGAVLWYFYGRGR